MKSTERVLSFSPYAYWRLHALYEIAICHNLQWRGHSYNYVSCDGLFSDCDMFWESTVGPRPADACATCQSQVKATLEGARIPHLPLGKFKTPATLSDARSFEKSLSDHELLDAVYRGHPVGAWVKSSVHSHLRTNELDLTNPKHCAALRSYLYSGAVAMDCITGMLDELQPTIMLLFNGRMSFPRIALELAKARGIRVVCHERGLSKETLLLWENEGCLALTPYEQLWKQWGEVPLAPEESAKVTQWLIDRAHGTNLNWKAFSVQSSLGPVAAFLEANQGRKIWTLFTSSTDEMVADRPSAFGTQYRWIEETIAFVRQQPGVALVIRVHPNSGGKKSTGKNLGEIKFFETLRATVPANVMVVMPDDTVSSYALIDRTDLGFVYGSTVALEMACRGKPVLLAAHSPWMYCPAITLLTAPERYAELLATYVTAEPDAVEAERIAIAAFRFAYAYVQRWNIPFPLVKMPDIHSGAFAVKTLAELKPGVHACLDYCTEIVLGLRPSVPVATEPVRAGAAQAEIDALRSGLKTLAGHSSGAVRFSVVITCYNYAKFLRNCVRSVANQTCKDFELIIVNDGSTDDSQAVAEACRRDFSDVPIRVLNQPNSGQPALARNAGIRLAKGQYILPLDADDLIGPQYLEQASKLIDLDPAVDFICANAIFDDGKTKTLAQPGRFDARLMATKNQFVYCCIYRRALWEKIGGYRDNVRGCEDWDFWVAIAVAGAKPGFIPCIGLIYNQKETGVYAETVAHHAARAAQIKANNPGAFPEESAPAVSAPVARATSGRIIALMSAFNEGDIIYHAIGDLIANGVDVYLLDNNSTDNTVSEASKWLGRGLLKIERFPEEAAGFAARCSKEFVLREQLRRKEELAAQLDGAWFINVDADEFRESPWPDKTLAEGIREVDRLGYNAINFELLNFRPTDDAFVPGEDVRRHLVAYEPGELFDALQIKAWKNPGARVQLASNGGHSVGFEGRKVFPLNFILRHYPIRGETHGRRKIFQERLPRFAREEVAQQWHVQYNEFIDGGKKFLHCPEELVVYQRDRFCAALLARFTSDLLLAHSVSGQVVGGARVQPAAALAWAGRSLEMTEPLSGEVATQAEQLLGGLLQALSQKQDVPVAEIEPALRRLLLTLLEMKLAYARLTADAHFVGVGNRLRRLLEQPAATSAEPASPGASTPEAAEPTALVSLCIPTYNGEEFVGETLRSALAQTYGQIEIIVSDDQSSDRTLEIVERLVPESRFPVRILRHDRLGLVGNWSHCIAEARGKYIKFLFQDDLLDPDCVRQLVTVAESDPAIGLVFRRAGSNRVAISPAIRPLAAAVRDSADVHRGWSRLQRMQDGTELLRDPRLLENPINKIGEPTTVLLAKEAIEAVGGFDASLRQLVDVELWLRLMTRYKVGFVDRALSCFRLHAKQTTQENLRNGLIAEDWRRFYAKLANDPAFATLPEPHRTLARRASARVSAPVATAAMPSARPAAAGEFQRRMKEAEESVRHGRVQEAIARVESALQVAPDEATASRAREILTMLADASANAAGQSAATGPSGDDFFGAEERANVEQLLAAYAANPADPAAREPVVALQRSLVDFLLGSEPGRLEGLFRGDFGQVFRAVIASGLPFEPASDESAAQIARIDAAMAAGGASFDVRPLVARMLLAPPHRGFVPVSLERIPAWLEEDYFRFLLQAPPVFLQAGEAEQFHDHLLGCARMIWQRTRTLPKDPLTIRIASFFALKGSFVPTYFNALNVRELAEKRAAIMEFALRQRGAVIDATFKRRPKDRQRIKVGFVNAHFGAQTETHVTLPMLQLDRSKFEICLFATAANEGPVEDRCRALADAFTVLPDNLNGQVRTIRDAQLDIVIIGTNVTAVTNQVALIALHRLAPVQLASYCSPVSTGMRHIDGYLTGSLLDSPEIRSHFTEQLHVCDGAPGCLDYTVEEPASLSGFDRARLGLAADDVVFVNAAACFKILPQMVETWAAILQATPKSRLLLMPFNPNWSSAFPTKQFERSLTECFARHGLSRDRFVMVGSLPSRADVKALEQVADVYLDTMPFSGSISIVDPLEIGLPVVTATGRTHRSRMAAALLQELGLPELVAADEAGYRALAIRLGTDAAFRRQSEERILAAMGRRPKFINPQAYAADLGRLLESLVKGRTPRPVLAETAA